jgi:biotin carboxyl carrier protein
MAELSERAAAGTPDASSGRADGHEPVVEAPAPPAPVVADGSIMVEPLVTDPRAVRVRLAPASRLADEPPIRVARPGEPLRMTNPTIGRGPLGGAAAPGAAGSPAPDVFAHGQLLVDDEPVEADLAPVGHGRYVLHEGPTRTSVVLERGRAEAGGVRRREVLVDGFRFEVDVEPERIAALRERASRGRASSAHHGPLEVRAIIPGKVVSVSVAAGDAVTAGQQLLVVEAMKMQNELRAPRDGTIERVAVAPGVAIEVGDPLVVIS